MLMFVLCLVNIVTSPILSLNFLNQTSLSRGNGHAKEADTFFNYSGFGQIDAFLGTKPFVQPESRKI